MKIAIFDSGIGGRCLLSELSVRLPNVDFIYYADSDHAPYGERTAQNVLELTNEAVNRLISKGADAVLLACNTATAVAARELREKHSGFPIFGMEPAVNQAAKEIQSGLILATATPVTLRGEKYRSLLDRVGIEDRVISLPLPQLVRFAEKELFSEKRDTCPRAEEYLRREISSVCPSIDDLSAAVLGCTHFIYFKKEFRRILKDIPIFDGVRGTANHLIRTLGLTEGEEARHGQIEFLISGREATSEERARFVHCLELLKR